MSRMWIWVMGGVLAVMLAVVFMLSRLSHPTTTGSVGGRVWVTATSGQSFDLRNTPVFLLRETVTPRQLRQASQRVVDEIKRRAATASDHSGILDDAKALDAKIAAMPADVPVRDAIAAVNAPPFDRYGMIGLEDFYVAAFRTTMTDAAGRYAFEGVPVGLYVVTAKTPAGVVATDVIVRRGAVQADLH